MVIEGGGDRVALVAGANRGIGREVVRQLMEHGVRAILTARNEEAGRAATAELAYTGILVNAVCPGWIATDMGGAGGRPVREGAARVLWAVLPDADGPTGGFFRYGRPLPW